MGMRRGRPAALALIGALLGLGGCITDQGTLQIVAPRSNPDELRNIEIGKRPVRREVIGRDTRITSILVVPTFDGPNLERAVADALVKGGGDLLVGAQVRTIEFWFLVGWSVLEVRGDVVDLSASGEAR
jgi:hypothetical protein